MKKATNKTDQELIEYCKKLIDHKYNPIAIEFGIDEFRRLYTFVTQTRGNKVPITSLISLGNEVYAQFSDISPQRFLINAHKFLQPDDFDFVVDRQWFGPTKRTQSFLGFVWSEFKQNTILLLVVFVVSFALLLNIRSESLYDLWATLIIQASTVFLSIYLIFTVSQSQSLNTDKKLFVSGILQKYYTDDRNLAWLAIITIGITFLNVLIFHTEIRHAFQSINIVLPSSPFNKYIFLAASNSIALIMLIDTFLSVVNYYLQRTRAVLERDVIDEILHEEFEKSCPDAQSKNINGANR